MAAYIVHIQSPGAAWVTKPYYAESAEDALRAGIYARWPWLRDYPHELTLDVPAERFRVLITGEPATARYRSAMRVGTAVEGRLRIGSADDCPACCGTGSSRYNPHNVCGMCLGKRHRHGRKYHSSTPTLAHC